MGMNLSAQQVVDALRTHKHLGIEEWGLCFGSIVGELTVSEACKAAEKYLQGEAEKSSVSVVGCDDEAARSLQYVVEALENAAASAERNGDEHVFIGPHGLWPTTMRDAVRAIKALQAERQTPAASAEPGVEECLAAVNRAGHRGGNYRLVAKGDWPHNLDQDELLGLGRLFIDRERATAKGGVE
jgi:hypothetical protein